MASATQNDLQNAVDAGLRYRLSVHPGVDFAFEAHRVQATGTASSLGTFVGEPSLRRSLRPDWWGVGVRRTFARAGFRPFLQAGMVHAREFERHGDSEWESRGSALGVALAAGGELALGSSLSVPIEVGWVHASPRDDLSILGLRSGLTWHPGR